MSDVIELKVGWRSGELFSENYEYVVPMYQRDFAWGEEEIKNLLTDIEVFNAPEYYLGSLVVSKTSNENGKDCFEVIDGQQRLTALFMTLCILDAFNKADSGKYEFNLRGNAPLRYECRERTERFFRKIKEMPLTKLIEKDCDPKDEDETIADGTIENAFNEIKGYFKINPKSEEVSKECIDKLKSFRERLQKVKILRVEVPEGTNLNQYYERMNTRSEQLEQTDILKSKLMGLIEAKEGREFFAKIWNACADMDHYVQMGFDTVVRADIFGKEWDKLNVKRLESKMNECSDQMINDDVKLSIDEIISNEQKYTADREANPTNDALRFESIVSFPVFLIHAYKIYVRHRLNLLDDAVSEMDPKDLNEAKLVDIFKLSTWEKDSPKEFIKTLLCLRFLFDKFIIKRDFSDMRSTISEEGRWSLLSLHSTDDGKQQSYANTRDGEDKNSGDDAKNRRCRMIQACLRVSYTAPRSMHWITCLLDEIYTRYLNADYDISSILIDNVIKCCERIAAKATKSDFLDCQFRKPDGSVSQYCMGVWTPHLVFHFLDYLLWKDDQSDSKKNFDDFIFTFRNSVEHWHPQNIDMHFVGKWNEKELENGLDSFGNLGIVTPSANSKLSNLAPSTKATDRADIIKQGSLKLRKMREITMKNGWTYQESKKHQDEMIRLLSESCEKILSVAVQ